MQYDIAVIGNDEAAFEMLTLAGGTSRRSVAIVPELRHSDWLVSRALRRLVSGLLVDRTARRRELFRRAATPKLLRSLISRAVAAEADELIASLEATGVDVVSGEPRFVDASHVIVARQAEQRIHVAARHIVIGTGVRRRAMHRPVGLVPFCQPESLLSGFHLPTSVTIIGGHDFGAGLAALISLFGVNTGFVAQADDSAVMMELAATSGVDIGFCPEEIGVADLRNHHSNTGRRVVDCRRDVGFTDHLGLDTIDVEADENGQLWCAGSFETWCSGVFGIGTVVGFSPDTALHPSMQAERVMSRIVHGARRPHLRNVFARSTTV